jgi:peptidoglycan hydrolase CwlO-like protein
VGALALTNPHDEFLELCAVSTSGQLTEEEQKRLQEHLVVCQSCREALKQYETIVSKVIPAIAVSETPECDESDYSWSEEQAEKALFERLDDQGKDTPKEFRGAAQMVAGADRLLPFSSESTWRHLWMLYAAGILLFATLSFYAYRVGVERGVDSAKMAPPPASTGNQASLEAQLSDAGHERQLARAQIEQRDKTIAELRQQLTQQSTQINELRAAKDQLESDLDTNRQDLVQQRSELAQKLDAAQSSAQALQQKLDALDQQSLQDATRVKAWEAKVNELTGLLHDREQELNEKDELLAHDRDIRELMGARDLYIAEVHDVARDGRTQIPYGRVFYTKGKSLIFYAYDLDRQAELKRAGSFQAWGRRGPDRQQAVNLGVFYEDSGGKKRWILKYDDAKMLEQIDAVFVTVEPNGGSHKPSGKSLLFASLKIEPNHP